MNREIYPGGLYPIAGDVTSQAGNTKVTVTGISGVSISTGFLTGGDVLMYDPNTNTWVYQNNGRILVNDLAVSDDYYVSVNVARPIKVNGV